MTLRRLAPEVIFAVVLTLGACRAPVESSSTPAPAVSGQQEADNPEALFLASLQRNFPECQASRRDALSFDVRCNGETLVVNLDNVVAETSGLSKSERALAMDRWVKDGFSVALGSAKGTVEQLVLLVRPVEMLEGLGGDDEPLTEPLAGNLLAVYGFDSPSAVYMAARSEIKELGLGGSMRQTALDNLRARLPEPQIHGGKDDVVMVTWGGTYEASLLLYPEIWDELAETVPGEVVVAAPARDLLFATGSESEAGLARLRSALVQIEQDPDVSYRLSSDLLRWSDGRWQLFP